MDTLQTPVTATNMPSLRPFVAHRLHLELEAREPILLSEHKGSSLRGMFYRGAMSLVGKPARPLADDLPNSPLSTPRDPVQQLMAALDEEGERGKDAPRLYAVEPPLEPTCAFALGEQFSFGITLFGWAIDLFPYVLMALKQAQHLGVGRRSPQTNQRGQFKLTHAWVANPFTGQTRDVYIADSPAHPLQPEQIRLPDLPITHDDIPDVIPLDMAGPPQRLQVRFLTPVTLKHRGQLVRVPEFHILLHRIMERLTELSRVGLSAPVPSLPNSREARNALLHQADAVQLTRNDTRWAELYGYSDRRRSETDLSGLLGTATYECNDFSPFLQLLRWGEVIHAGNHAVKGNGWFQLR